MFVSTEKIVLSSRPWAGRRRLGEHYPPARGDANDLGRVLGHILDRTPSGQLRMLPTPVPGAAYSHSTSRSTAATVAGE